MGGRRLRRGATLLLTLVVCLASFPSIAIAQDSRFLAKADILLYGIALKVEPAQQTVPKNIATIVSTFLQAPTQIGDLPPFAPDAVVMATLRGPSFAKPLDLTTSRNTPFNIPPLTVAGLHTLENIRLVSSGQVLLRATPETATINVIEKLLVTQVTARPLTAAEIREKGIVFDKSNFQAYNFTAAFALKDGPVVNINFPILLPAVQGAADVKASIASIPAVQTPPLKTLATIIPDTLAIQRQVPNLSVIGFTLKEAGVKGQELILPPIPGVIVIPGNIGFLDQFFSVLLMVSNAAPDGSNLVVSDLTASIILPPGNDTVVGSGDDPLAMARTEKGVSLSVRPVTQPGLDGQLGTADDITTIGPGETGNAEYLVEGRREGSHVVEMAISGTLNGLPAGPVPITGRAAGVVLVRNPAFTLTFVHPDTVVAGERYTLDVTVTNTSTSPANIVSVNLLPRYISGATLVGDASKSIDFIAPGDAANVTFDLISNVTGQVTAATLDADTNVSGRFLLKHSVGELGIPLSPESLVLPREAGSLPKSLRDAAVGLLGKAWSVATAPAGALPKDVLPFSKQIVLDRGVDVAEAGLRVSLREPLRDSVTQLAMDFFGSAFNRLSALIPKPDDLQFARDNYTGWDDLRRRTIRGDTFAQAVAALLAPDVAGMGASAFHADVARKIAYRPPHISVLLTTSGGRLPFSLSLFDSQHRLVGTVNDAGKVLKQTPFGDYLTFQNGAGDATGQMAFLVAPLPGDYSARLDSVPGVPANTPFALSVVVPRADGTLRHLVFDNLTSHSAPQTAFAASDAYRLSVSVGGPADNPVAPSTDAVITVPPPSVVAVVQKADADILPCIGLQAGRVISVLFSSEVTAASAQDKFNAANITNYVIEGNKVVSVALQPGGRIALLALRDPIGPHVPRTITISGVADAAGRVMDPQTLTIVSTVTDAGGVVSGRVLEADGTPIPFASVRLFTYTGCPDYPWAGISSKNADAQGGFSWDFVLRDLERIVAVDPESGQFRDVQFNVQRDGQRLNVDIVLLGRGIVKGRTLDENGQPLRLSNIRVTSLTDQSQYGATSAADGTFTIAQVPVGNVLIEAVNTTANAKGFVSDSIPFAGATTTRDLVLFNVSKDQVTVQHGNVSGHVLTDDGATVVKGVPVIVYYTNQSQPGVTCPAAAGECPIATTTTDDQGAFAFPGVVAGSLRIHTINQPTFQEGDVRVPLAADASVTVNILLAAGLGTVHGTVIDVLGKPVPNARVGGGLSLATSDANGAFTLTDVPVGHATIVAVSDALHSKGMAEVDIVRAGEAVNVTIVLELSGGVAGTVRLSDGTTPAVGIRTYLFTRRTGSIHVLGSAVTDDQGHFSFSQVPVDDFPYFVSAFRSDFSDGNFVRTSVQFANQVARADVTFRGGGGQVSGTVFDDDGMTPLKARVGISGDQPVIAGGQVVVGFQHVANFAIADTNFTTGTFALSGLWVGPFTLNAVGQFSPDPVALEGLMPSAGATVHMDIRLQPTSTIAGVVLQPDGVTPAGANVVVKYKSEEFKSICSEGSDGEQSCTSIPQGIQEEVAVTDDQGRFLLPLVNGGRFTISAEDQSSGKRGQINGTIKAGEAADLFVRLSGVGTVVVEVIGSDAHTPIPGAKVVVTQIDYPRQSLIRFADTQGVLTLAGADGFSEGQFVVVATDVRNGFTGRASGRVETDGQQVVVKVFLFNQTGTVHGTVFRSDGLTPVANAEVVLAGGAAHLPLAFALTASDGSYSMDQIPLGAFSVEVFEAATARRGFASSRVDFDQQDVAVDVTESALGMVRGTALDAKTLDALKGWTVNLTQSLPSGRSVSLQGMTSVDGTFSFPGVPKGAVRLFASKQSIAGTGQTTGAITREGQVVDLPILVSIVRPLVGTIAGRVFNPDGSPAANSLVELGLTTSLTTDADGAFSSQQPLGRYQVRARSQTSANAGSALVQLSNDGETVGVTVTMTGLSRIDGHVEHSDGSPAPNVQVVLQAYPTAGCAIYDGSCTGFTNAAGDFSFVNVPAQWFTISATEAISGLRGAIGDTLEPGSTANVRIVLQPSGSLSGRVLLQNGGPASGIVAELTMSGRHLFMPTGADGRFTFGTVPLGAFSLAIADQLRGGIAKRAGTIGGAVDLGDVTLDETPPAVASVTPAAGSSGMPLNQAIHLVFSEKIDAGTINGTNITVSDGSSAIAGTLLLESGDASALFTPIAPLKESTRYTVRVKGIKDLVGKTMAVDFVAAFTTVDLTPATFVEISPAQSISGVTASTTIRLTFSEPIDPTKFVGAPILLTSGGVAVDGRTDYLFGNTVLVFTPTRPLSEGAIYRVQVGRAADLAGNVQATALDYQFSTTDRTPPQLVGLIAPPSVVENGTASVVADAGTSFDIAVVDFYINGTPVAAPRTAPFTLTFQAIPSFGKPGDQIKVSAFATDTSGNRATVETAAFLTVTPDQPPVVAITSPSNGVTARNGDLVTVVVRATDDLGVTKQGYKAQTGKPQDAALVTLSQASLDHTQTFSFHVPADAAPGSTIAIEASALDTKGQVGQAAPVSIAVLDSVPPVVSITGASTGQTVRPGQTTSVVISAQDLGGVSTINFSTAGAAVIVESRTLDGAPTSALVSFSVQVPANAVPGGKVTLNATGVDKAGNIGHAAPVDLPVADTVAPAVQLRTDGGASFIVSGRSFTVLADASDGIGVARVELTGSGAFTVSDVKQVAPPTGDAHVSFTVNVPASTPAGAVLNLQARAFDTSNNVSTTAFLSLTVKTLIDVVLPPSVVVKAGQSIDVAVQVPGGGPAAGQLVTFTTTNAGVATVTPSLVFGTGETSKPIAIAGQSGGSVTISALVQGVERANMTATVQGGVVDGTIFDQAFTPVSGAVVTVTGQNGQNASATTGADGKYSVVGIFGPAVSVHALDSTGAQRGFTTATMTGANGFAHVNVVLLPAGAIHGVVHLADTTTPAPAGVKVDLFLSSQPFTSLATTFTTAAGAFEFPVVNAGTYTIDATATDGNRGRTTATVLTGADTTADITYLGRGSVFGTIVDAGGVPVPNATLTFRSTSIFGSVVTTQNAAANGTYRFDGVFVGTFDLTARDPVTNRAAAGSGAIANDGQLVLLNLSLSPYATLQGTVRRFDGTTTVPNATVSISGVGSTKTDAQGFYQFPIVPLGWYAVTVNDPATRGLGRTDVTLATNGQTVTADVPLLGQGSVVATVVDANAAPVSGASITILAINGSLFDNLFGITAADGTVVVDHVLAGQLTINASKSGLTAQPVVRTLSPGELAQVTLTLQATASIAGTVFAPDGQTPQSTGYVRLMSGINFVASSTLAAGGAYHFDGMKLGTYTLQAFDTLNHLRATTSVTLTDNGQVETKNLTFFGEGNVAGRVLNPNGSGAPSLQVQVVSADPTYGRTVFAITDAAGNYAVNNLALGAITASVSDLAHGQLGQASGTLATNGQLLTLNVLLQSNAFNFPITLLDASTFTFDLQADGSIRTGTTSVFNPAQLPRTGAALSVVSGAATIPFTGATIGTKEDQGREVATRQTNVAGLNITRKVFVPSTGYFARYLEIVANPTQAPITVDLQITSGIRVPASPGISLISTSSGDAVLDISDPANSDRWAVIDDVDQDPFLASNNPSLAFTFDGAGAPRRVGTATFSPNNGSGTGVMKYGWTNVTVPPGATVAFMHFVTQETSRAGAVAAAQRLSQLPPEALPGLAADEIAQIGNFAVPADGSSTVAPLPALGGSVTGTLFEYDGTTALNRAGSLNVWFKSTNPLFGRTFKVSSDASGHFTLTAKLSADSTQIVVPIEGFTLSSLYPQDSLLMSPSYPGMFNVGESVAVQNVVFTNTGSIAGIIRRQNGQALTGATGTVNAGGIGMVTRSVSIGADGSFLIHGVADGTKTLSAAITNPQGTALFATALTTAHVGQVVTQDVVLGPLGAVAGVVRTGTGNAAPGVTVNLAGTGVSRSTITSGTGAYTLSDVPVGSYTVTAIEPNSLVPTSAFPTVVQDQTTTQDFTLVALGTLSVQVNYANGTAATGAQVQINVPSVNQTFKSVGTTDGTGHINVANVPAVFVQVRALNPVNGGVFVDGFATLTSSGQVLPVALTMPFAGTITGTVRYATGALATGTNVQLMFNGVAKLQTQGSATYTFSAVGTPPNATIRAFNPQQTNQYKDATNLSFTGNSQTITANITLPAQATLRVTSLIIGARVKVKSAFDTDFVDKGVIDSAGTLLVPNVPEGLVLVLLVAPAGSPNIGVTSVTIGPGDQGLTIDVPFTFVTLPVSLTDANGMVSDIQLNGALRRGSNNAFNIFGEQMTVTVSPTTSAFSGSNFGQFEDGNREIGITQNGLNSGKVNVTRKVFVPADGYFTRYLETLTNPTAVAQTATVLIYATSDTHVVASSDGNTSFNAGDRWIVSDDDDGSQTSPPTRPAMAFVLGGEGASVGLETAIFQPSQTNTSPWITWTVTIPAGQSAILMHFLSQQPQQAGGIAAANRLAQLPPEAMAGMSASERAAVVNWVVPADGVGTVPPLPARTGVVTGRLLMGDGQTVMPNVPVTLTSPNAAVFAAKTATTGANGVFTFTGVTLDTFTLKASDPITHVAATVTANFTTGQTTATQDLVFTNTGVVRGTVTRLGLPAVGATVMIVAGPVSATVVSQAGGAYLISGLTAGSYTIEATAAGAQGAAVAEVISGQSTTANIVIGSGSISGKVVHARGVEAIGATVQLVDPLGVFQNAQTITDANGNFTLASAVVGAPYVVKATHPTNPYAVVSSAPLAVSVDGQSVQVNLTLPASATARVTVLEPDGVTPLDAFVTIDRHDGQGFQQAGWTDVYGVIAIPNVTGQFTVSASDAGGTIGTVAATVTTASDGGVVNVSIIAIGGLATVSGTAYAVDGTTPLPDGEVTVQLVDGLGQVLQESTNARFSFVVRLTSGDGAVFYVQATSSLDPGSLYQGTGFSLSAGTVVDDANVYLAVPVVFGTVMFADGTPAPFPNVMVLSTDAAGDARAFFATRTNEEGEFGVPVLQLGAFSLTAQDAEQGLTAVVTGNIGSSGDSIPKNVTLPPAVSLSGTVIEQDGTPVPGASVSLAVSSGVVTRSTVTDQSGFFSFDVVEQSASYRLAACDAASLLCGNVIGTADGFSPATIVVAPTQTVAGTVFDMFFNPVGGASVSVYASATDGAPGADVLAGITTTTAADGTFVVNNAPPDNLSVTAFAYGQNVGVVQPSAGGPGHQLLLGLENAIRFDYLAIWPSARRLRCDGTVDGGPGLTAFTTSTLQMFAPAGGAALDTFPCVPYASLQVSPGAFYPILNAGYRTGTGLQVSRQIYVSSGGLFTRYLEVLTNPSSVPVSVRVRISGAIASGTPALTRSPSQNGNTYAVFNDGAGLGLVFGGAGAAVAATPSVATGRRTFSYDWVVTVPPNETRRLMHFVVQSGAGDTTTTTAANTASGLATLSYLETLAGMSPEERSSVVNFHIP